MGWSFFRKPDNVKKWLIDNLASKFECLECKIKMRTAYMAVRDKDSGQVFAIITLLQYVGGEYNFGYKDMTETWGPYEADCPRSILEKLSPTSNDNALAWRAKCWENVRRREAASALKSGDQIQFKVPIKFSNGAELDTFRYEWNKRFRKARFIGPDGVTYRISNWKTRNFVVV